MQQCCHLEAEICIRVEIIKHIWKIGHMREIKFNFLTPLETPCLNVRQELFPFTPLVNPFNNKRQLGDEYRGSV